MIAILDSTAALSSSFVLIAVAASPEVFLVGLVLVLAFSAISGFVVAHIAGRRELVHAAVAGFAFVLISALVYPRLEIGDIIGPVATALPLVPLWHNGVMYGLILLAVPVALAGGYMARVRRDGKAFLSSLTYGAMAAWGIGETIDSIPSLIGPLGLTFMVYSGAVWFLALLLAIGSSIPLMFLGPRVHRRRVVTWYLLLVMVGLSASVGVIPRLAAEVVAAAMPILWLGRTIGHGKVGGTGPITRIATVALIALACAACGQPEPTGRVFFIQPTDGATVQGPVRLEFGAENFRIAAAPAGGWGSEDRPDLGHYHVAIDADCVSTRFTGLGQPTIPPAAPWVHLDDGKNIIDMQLPPGPHRLTLQIGDDMGRTIQGLCSTISVTVAE